MSTNKGIEKIIELHDKLLINSDRKVSKKIDLVVYIGETVDYFNTFLGKKQKWPEKIIRALKKVDTNFYKEFDIGFNYEFKEWQDAQELWTAYLSGYDQLSKEEKDAFKKINKKNIKFYIQAYEKYDYFDKCFFNLVVQHKVINQESHSKKIILGITGNVDIKYDNIISFDICFGVACRILADNPIIPQDDNYGYIIVGHGYKSRSPSRFSKHIQHEISHLLDAKHCGGYSVMNSQRSRCKHWDKKNKEIIRDYIKRQIS